MYTDSDQKDTLLDIHRNGLDKIEWRLLLEHLESYAQTQEAKQAMRALKPNLKREQIEQVWSQVLPIKSLVAKGYHLPIDELTPVGPALRAATLGQILSGEDLVPVADLLMATKKLLAFAESFAESNSTLARFGRMVLGLPHLSKALEDAIDAKGQVLDTASPELAKIRRQKQTWRKRIEDKIRKVLQDRDIEKYLQDDFFTIRHEKYVVPIRLDGRGRVQGSITDTSDSGQTLFIEPVEIAPMNDQMRELEVGEKLEVARILKQLSGMVSADAETLAGNYEEIVLLDGQHAQAQLAQVLEAGPVELVDKPHLELVRARHPALCLQEGLTPVPNDIAMLDEQRVLIISGPNAGGKTVVLKTVGLLQVMLASGLLIPAEPQSKMYLWRKLYVEMGDEQSLSSNLSTFSGHMMGLKPIVEHAREDDLVLLDELAMGTEPQTGSAIAQAVVEHLAQSGAHVMVTTHYDSLKVLATDWSLCRNASMEYSPKHYKASYRLVLDVPGQSFGLEVASKLGFPSDIMQRAQTLRGSEATELEQAVGKLADAHAEVMAQKEELRAIKLAAEQEQARFEQERQALSEVRKQAARKAGERYRAELERMKDQFFATTRELKEVRKQLLQHQTSSSTTHPAAKASGQPAMQRLEGLTESAKGVLGELDHKAHALGEQAEGRERSLPGRAPLDQPIDREARVFVLPLNKEGVVVRVGEQKTDPLEIQVGALKLRVARQDLRLLGPSRAKAAAKGQARPQQPQGKGEAGGRPAAARSEIQADQASQPAFAGSDQRAAGHGERKPPEFVIRTATNQLDLRGLDGDTGVRKMWDFVDAALIRGERALMIVHGHGTARLKQRVRTALDQNPPYDLVWRPGQDGEGGDGVVVVYLCD